MDEYELLNSRPDIIIDREWPKIQEAVSKVRLEERERCAKIADGYAKVCSDGEHEEGKAASECIAEEIRKG